MRNLKRSLILLGGLAILQVIPYGRDHTNPPTIAEPAWDSRETRNMVKEACFDCHSNETVWPWYSDIAPVSWMVYKDVKGARERLNFSEWKIKGNREELSEKISKKIIDGDMPPYQYKIVHKEARLSSKKKAKLIEGLKETIER